jgi:hypothetical protein
VDRNYEVVIWSVDGDQHDHYFWEYLYRCVFVCFCCCSYAYYYYYFYFYFYFYFFVVFLSRFLYLSYIYGREEGFSPSGWCIHQRGGD